MRKTIGYMITWTTYGSWLQGDKRGYVKNGRVLKRNEQLRKSNRDNQKLKEIRLSKEQRKIVEKAILDEAKKIRQRIYAIIVFSNHVHILGGNIDEPIGSIVARYKNAGYFALRKDGFQGKVWTRGYDKRYCFDEKSLKDRIDYVRRHD